MSHPGRSLNNRALPPLLPNSSFAVSAAGKDAPTLPQLVRLNRTNRKFQPQQHNSPIASFGGKMASPFQGDRQHGGNMYRPPDLTQDTVTIYLRDHPEFLEAYVMKHSSAKQLLTWATRKAQLQDMPDDFASVSELTPSPGPSIQPMPSGNPMSYQDPSKSATTNHHLSLSVPNSVQQQNQLAPPKLKDGWTATSRPSTSGRRTLAERTRVLRKLTHDINLQPSTARILAELKDCIATAIGADGANLYIVNETGQTIYHYNPLVENSLSTSAYTFPVGSQRSVVAWVAATKELERIVDVCADERFPECVPLSGNLIQSILAQPVMQDEDRVAGVIEFYRTAGHPPFSEEDEEVAHSSSIMASAAVACSEMYHKNNRQQRLNSFILDVAQSMFGKFKSMESVIKDIMKNAKDLVKADRASLFLVDKDSSEMYSSIFDVGSASMSEFVTKDVVRFQLDRGIAGHVATTGETLNIMDAYSDPRFNRGIDQQTGYTTRTILCMPVKLQAEVIGVVQMLNKVGGQFTKEDEFHFKTFATYCGLALHIAKMYEKIRRSEQKHKVALEVLSYHSRYQDSDLIELKDIGIPELIPHITEITYSPWSVTEKEKPIYVIYMFQDLFGMQRNSSGGMSARALPARVDIETLMRFTLTVRKNYRHVPYHNWAHAFSVAQSMYTIIKTTSHELTTDEALALYVSCLCHDLDHRGKTNQFMVKTATPLAAIYSTSTMEHHHFNMTVTILQLEGHNIFRYFSSETYKHVLGNIKHCILATDLSRFFDYRARLDKMITGNPKVDWDSEDARLVVMAVAMTTCDLCSMYKPWKIQLSLVMVIMEEFWIQGDEERLQGQTPIRMMDREYRHELPESQVGFIKGICLPCYTILARVLPELNPMVDGAKKNLSQWESIASLSNAAERSAKLIELDQSLQGKDRPVLHMT